MGRFVLVCLALAACGKVLNKTDGGTTGSEVPARCGDGVVNGTEQCDDGNQNPNDGCSNTCTFNAAFPSDGSEGPFAPTASTSLSPGVHNFTTINIPSNVTVTTSGTGILELRATGAVQIDGTVDVSGGRGGDGATGPGGTAACDDGGGQGGATGVPTAGIDGTTLTCPNVAAGGQGSAGSNGLIRGSNGGCDAIGGSFGGGAGGGCCGGGGGGGGVAGGGGGAGYSPSNGGSGASSGADVGGVGGIATTDQNGVGKTNGGGGMAPAPYTGQDGSFVMSCAIHVATGGGGGSIGATAAGDLAVATTFVPGSGGGGGGGQCNACNIGSGGGGGGGGALRIASTGGITLGASAKLLANGGAGGNGGPHGGSQGGGGGSGGVIYLATPTLMVASGATISAVGGAGGTSNGNCGGGGTGGLGRVRLSVRTTTCTLLGSVMPPLTSGCTASTAAGMTYIAEYPN